MFSSGGDEEDENSDVLAKRRAKVIAKNEAKRDQEQAWENARTAQKTQQMQNAIAKNYNLAQAEAEMGKVKPITPYVVSSYIDKDEENWLKGKESQRAWAAVNAQEQAKVINIAVEENGQIESNNLIVSPNSIQDVQSLYFKRDPLWQSNLQSDSNIEAADAITNIAGPSAPTTRLDYFLAAVNVNLYLETNTTWWRQFTRWGSGYGPDAKSIVNYYPAATGISLNDSQGIVLSDTQVYAYTYVDKLIIRTRVFDKYGNVVYSQADLLPEVKVCNEFHSSHSYEYPKKFFIPITSNSSLVKIEIYYSAGAFKGESIHEIYQK